MIVLLVRFIPAPKRDVSRFECADLDPLALREMSGPRMRIGFACVEKESHGGWSGGVCFGVPH